MTFPQQTQECWSDARWFVAHARRRADEAVRCARSREWEDSLVERVRMEAAIVDAWAEFMRGVRV